MPGELEAALRTTLSQNPNDQKRALDFLNHASTTNFTGFVYHLSVVIRSRNHPDFVRQAAGLQLKNVLHSKDEGVKKSYLERWLTLPLDIRTNVKTNVIEALGTEPYRPSIAAQCVASIACAELPTNNWPQVISVLMNNVTIPNGSEMLRESSLETLGYICQDIDAKVLEAQANAILTAIVHGMQQHEPSNHVKLAATNALYNALEFTSNNFNNDPERHIIMQVVCETTQSPEINVKVAALQCLVRIMTLYYQLMESYMLALFPITVQVMKSKEDNVALQGIEFWSNVCEEEISLAVEADEAADNGRIPTRLSRYYARGATSHLCPTLLETLAKQEEGDDDDDWTPSKAAGVCIMLLAQCVGDDILQCVMPFFNHFASDNWKYKDAAIMAFGSILDGPDPVKLQPLVQQAMMPLIQAMSDKKVEVRDSTAWTIGRILEVCPEIVGNNGILQALLPALSQGLQQEPRVASNICWALMALVKAAYELGKNKGTDSSGEPETFVLSPVFQSMVEELIKVTDRPDSNQSNLRLAAFETLMELIKNSPKDCYAVVQQTTVSMLNKLEQLLNMETSASAADKNALADLQSLLCATLQSVLRKVRSEDAPLISDHIMNGLLQIMARSTGKAAGTVMEEALLAVSALAETLETGFNKYIELLKPHLIHALTSYEEAPVCIAAAGLMVDLCRCIDPNSLATLDQIMEQLVVCLREPRLHREARVHIVGNFGDIALAIGERFSRYADIVMAILNEASGASVDDPNDLDKVDYVAKLRENIINSYVGIVQSMCPAGFDKNPQIKERAEKSVLKYADSMVELIMKCCDPVPKSSDSLICNVCGLIGDLVSLFGFKIVAYFNNEKVGGLISRGRRSRVNKTKSVANWSFKEMRKATM